MAQKLITEAPFFHVDYDVSTDLMTIASRKRQFMGMDEFELPCVCKHCKGVIHTVADLGERYRFEIHPVTMVRQYANSCLKCYLAYSDPEANKPLTMEEEWKA
jgi:hypothetical protein